MHRWMSFANRWNDAYQQVFYRRLHYDRPEESVEAVRDFVEVGNVDDNA